MQGQVTRSGQIISLCKKTLQSRHNYNVWGKVMKLSEYDKVVGTYKAYVSNFLYLWVVTLGQVIFVTLSSKWAKNKLCFMQ